MWSLQAPQAQRSRVAQLFHLTDTPGLSVEALLLDDIYGLFHFTSKQGFSPAQTEFLHQIYLGMRQQLRQDPALELSDVMSTFKTTLLGKSVHASAIAAAAAATAAATTSVDQSAAAAGAASSSFPAPPLGAGGQGLGGLPSPGVGVAVPSVAVVHASSSVFAAGSVPNIWAAPTGPSTVTVAAAGAAGVGGAAELGDGLGSSSAASSSSSAASQSQRNPPAPAPASSPVEAAASVKCDPLSSEQCRAATDYFASAFFKHFFLLKTVVDPHFKPRSRVQSEQVLIETPILDGFTLDEALPLPTAAASASTAVHRQGSHPMGSVDGVHADRQPSATASSISNGSSNSSSSSGNLVAPLPLAPAVADLVREQVAEARALVDDAILEHAVALAQGHT